VFHLNPKVGRYTPSVKKPKSAKTFSQKSAEIFWSVGDDSSISFNDFDVDGCNIS
jgi:hypothetical protein